MAHSYHDTVELVRAVDRLVKPESLQQVNLHLKGVHVGKWLLCSRQDL
jgi:hypothetical protein